MGISKLRRNVPSDLWAHSLTDLGCHDAATRSLSEEEETLLGHRECVAIGPTTEVEPELSGARVQSFRHICPLPGL